MDIKSIASLIGNTPVVKISIKVNGKIKNIYAKLEYYNLTGSIKDRIAYSILKDAYDRNLINSTTPIIEATSGNTGISLSALGALLGNPVHIFMPDWASMERIKIIEMYGANIHLVSEYEGGFIGAINLADQLSNKLNGFRPKQFSNNLNTQTHYNTTGMEIVEKIPNIDAFVCGFGTGGTLMGVSKRLKEFNHKINTIALEPSNMTLLSENKVIGKHKIEGIGDDFLPDIIDKTLIDDTITIDDFDAINMSRRLSRELGLGVGISSGANMLASALQPYTNIVTIFSDDMKKYISTDLTKEKKDRTYLSDKIEFASIESL
jgi:cysteine synthase A